MARSFAWTLVFLACFALQVPWVQRVADCHEDVHPDVRLGECHPVSCDSTGSEEPKGGDESSHGEAAHIVVTLATIGSQQTSIDSSDLAPCHDFVRTSEGLEAAPRGNAASQRTVEPGAPAHLSAVLLL